VPAVSYFHFVGFSLGSGLCGKSESNPATVDHPGINEPGGNFSDGVKSRFYDRVDGDLQFDPVFGESVGQRLATELERYRVIRAVQYEESLASKLDLLRWRTSIVGLISPQKLRKVIS